MRLVRAVARSPRRRRRDTSARPFVAAVAATPSARARKSTDGAGRASKNERRTTQVQNVVKILGLRFGTKYTQENIKTLRYGHLMIMTDQDHDGRCLGVVSRRPVVWRRLRAIDARRLLERRSWVVSFSILGPFGPSSPSHAGPTSRAY